MMDFAKITDQVSKIKVKNVVDMPLFYALFFTCLGILSSIFSKHEWVTIVIFSVVGILVLLAIFGYLYFTFANPDYLRSEEFHLRKQSIEFIGDKENMLNPNVKEIVLIASPYIKQNGNNQLGE